MNKLIIFLMLIVSFGCTTADHQPVITDDTADTKKLRVADYLKVTDAPYGLKVDLEPVENNEYNLVVAINLYNDSYYASPFSDNDFMGLFNISLENNAQLTLVGELTETPRSVEVFDYLAGVPVNWVKDNTIYRQRLKALTEEDFETAGLVRFVIEPSCTLEEIEFVIASRSGKIEVTQE